MEINEHTNMPFLWRHVKSIPQPKESSTRGGEKAKKDSEGEFTITFVQIKNT